MLRDITFLGLIKGRGILRSIVGDYMFQGKLTRVDR